MMPGVAASMLLRIEAGDGYDGATAVADFMAGIYLVNGIAVSASDIIDNVGFIETGGLRMSFDVEGYRARMLGGLRDAFLSGTLTFVIEWQDDYANDDYLGPLNVADTSTGAGGAPDTMYQYTWPNQQGFYDQPDPGTNRLVQPMVSPGLTPGGVRRVACTRTNTQFAMSVNGSAVSEDTNTGASLTTPDEAYLGGDQFSGWSTFQGYIRRVIVYPPVTNAELPALSAL